MPIRFRPEKEGETDGNNISGWPVGDEEEGQQQKVGEEKWMIRLERGNVLLLLLFRSDQDCK